MEAAFRQLWRKFQSTLSVRRATWRPLTMEQSEAISIHALRKESDFGFRGSVAGKHISIHALRKESDVSGNAAAHDAISNFNPRSP